MILERFIRSHKLCMMMRVLLLLLVWVRPWRNVWRRWAGKRYGSRRYRGD